MGGADRGRGKKNKQIARERVAMLRAEQARQDRRRKAIVIGACAAVVALVVAGVTWGLMTRHTTALSATTIAGVRTYPDPSRNHVTGPVTYAQTPPVGGDHNPAWLNCGVYTAPVPNENAVHSMEHGAVWITYRPDLTATEVAKLTEDVAGKPDVLLSPYPDLPSQVVASAWGTQLMLSDASDPRLAEFIAAYAQGSQTPEPGAPCTGGTGSPQQ